MVSIVLIRVVGRPTVSVVLMSRVLTLVCRKMGLLFDAAVVRSQVGGLECGMYQQHQSGHRGCEVAADGARTGGGSLHGLG